MQSWQEFLAWEQASRQTIDFKTIYVDIAGGDILAGLLLSQIIFWHLPTQNNKSKLRVVHDQKIWLAKSDSQWFDEVRLTEAQARRARAVLTNLLLIETRTYKFNGTPITHIRVNHNALIIALKKQMNLSLNSNELESENKWTCAETQVDLSLNSNGLEPELKSLTETTTENTTKIKDQSIVQQAAHAHDSNQLSLFSDQEFEAELRRRTGIESLSISNVSDSERSDLPGAVGGKVDKSGRKILPRGGHAPDAFAAFWQQHPIKKGKLAAQTAWNRLKANSELIDTIMHDMANRKQNDRQWVEGFAPHPATYLNGARWTDEIEPLTIKKTGVQSEQDKKDQARMNAVRRLQQMQNEVNQ